MMRWGVELQSDWNLTLWRESLKPPIDPFVEEIDDERGKILVLRSSEFADLETAIEVENAAKPVVYAISAALAANTSVDSVNSITVVEFSPGQLPRRHHFLRAQTAFIRLRGHAATVTVTDANGNVVAPPPVPSRAQRWALAAVRSPEVSATLQYLQGSPGWVELYKAYEAIRQVTPDGASEVEIERFKRTANAGRHHPNPKIQPHKRPMGLQEAREFIARWVDVAIRELRLDGRCSP